MTQPHVGLPLIFGVVLSPIYLMLAGWFFGRPRDLRMALLGFGYFIGFIVAAWAGAAAFAFLIKVAFFWGT